MKKSINNDIHSGSYYKKLNCRKDTIETLKEYAKIIVTCALLLVGFYCLTLLAYAIS